MMRSRRNKSKQRHLEDANRGAVYWRQRALSGEGRLRWTQKRLMEIQSHCRDSDNAECQPEEAAPADLVRKETMTYQPNDLTLVQARLEVQRLHGLRLKRENEVAGLRTTDRKEFAAALEKEQRKSAAMEVKVRTAEQLCNEAQRATDLQKLWMNRTEIEVEELRNQLSLVRKDREKVMTHCDKLTCDLIDQKERNAALKGQAGGTMDDEDAEAVHVFP
eukprot:TRINITY_DN470_c0_g1_i2.p1 TRINITY_DN470_c0_g1~~TRINITY_DN470_c0_g1_i2.p1  ORF type:complete len:252 (+),score=90.42 TRINITY_DN470_c0_g1_i2:100-756(+)